MGNPVGNEIIYAVGVQTNGQSAAIAEPFTLQQVANLANTQDTSLVETAITTVGNGTLTAAGLVGGQILRTGPTAVYTDTTDTAANIVTALGEFLSGSTFQVEI